MTSSASHRRYAVPSLVVLVCATVATAAGCSDAFSPLTAVPGAVSMSPPADYLRWWGEVEHCSGLSGDFGRISWYAVPDVMTFPYRGADNFGYWWATHDIAIAGGSVLDSMVVRHEMLHDILNTGTHPEEYFLYRCWGVVDYRPDH